ncbi:uncharacterized protein [Chamaea fasciata]|uniref:uncharacterized protein n=1 Tax=Chamaea fasciata TaxID=190680 RepID=UPI00336A642B
MAAGDPGRARPRRCLRDPPGTPRDPRQDQVRGLRGSLGRLQLRGEEAQRVRGLYLSNARLGTPGTGNDTPGTHLSTPNTHLGSHTHLGTPNTHLGQVTTHLGTPGSHLSSHLQAEAGLARALLGGAEAELLRRRRRLRGLQGRGGRGRPPQLRGSRGAGPRRELREPLGPEWPQWGEGQEEPRPSPSPSPLPPRDPPETPETPPGTPAVTPPPATPTRAGSQVSRLSHLSQSHLSQVSQVSPGVSQVSHLSQALAQLRAEAAALRGRLRGGHLGTAPHRDPSPPGSGGVAAARRDLAQVSHALGGASEWLERILTHLGQVRGEGHTWAR